MNSEAFPKNIGQAGLEEMLSEMAKSGMPGLIDIIILGGCPCPNCSKRRNKPFTLAPGVIYDAGVLQTLSINETGVKVISNVFELSEGSIQISMETTAILSKLDLLYALRTQVSEELAGMPVEELPFGNDDVIRNLLNEFAIGDNVLIAWETHEVLSKHQLLSELVVIIQDEIDQILRQMDAEKAEAERPAEERKPEPVAGSLQGLN